MSELLHGATFRMRYPRPEDVGLDEMPVWEHVMRDLQNGGYNAVGAHLQMMAGDHQELMTPESMHAQHLAARRADGLGHDEAQLSDYREAWDALKGLGYLQERRVSHQGREYAFVSLTEVKGEFGVDLDTVSDDELLPYLS